MTAKPLSHDRLQQECFNYLWNKYPQTQYCCWHSKNESLPVSKEVLIYFLKFCKLFITEKIVDSFVSHFYSSSLRIKELAYYKSIGVLPGVLDLSFYWSGTLYIFDIKIGFDKLSQNQINFITAIEKQGGKHFVIASLKTFCNIVDKVINET